MVCMLTGLIEYMTLLLEYFNPMPVVRDGSTTSCKQIPTYHIEIAKELGVGYMKSHSCKVFKRMFPSVIAHYVYNI